MSNVPENLLYTAEHEYVARTSDPRLVYLHQPNRGPAAARNLALAAARGELVAFLDADDLWQPTKLERHLALMDADPRIGMSFSWFAVFQDGEAPAAPWFTPPTRTRLTWTDFLERNWTGHSSSVVVRTRCLRTLGGFDPAFFTGEDYHLWLRIAQSGWPIAFLGEPLSLYRKRPGSLTVDDLQIALDHLKVLENIAQRAEADHAPRIRRAIRTGWLDVAWSYLKRGRFAPALGALGRGYPAAGDFVSERLGRKLLAARGYAPGPLSYEE